MLRQIAAIAAAALLMQPALFAAQQTQSSSSSQTQPQSQSTQTTQTQATSTAQTAQAPSASTVAGAVPNGTRFLVRLEDSLETKKHKSGKKFEVKTMEPLVTIDGTVIPPGTEIKGRLSRVERAADVGRARLWLSFDEINVKKKGKLPIVALVRGVPGEHSVRAESKEGEIEARTSKGQGELRAAAMGAAIGAAAGAVAKGGKGSAMGAVIGAAAAFLVATGMGQELKLEKGTKLELELDRPLYIK